MAMDRNHLDVQIEDQVLRAVDPIDWEAHWALAAEHMREQRYADALPHFLICAFITAGNRDTWTNALLCALGMRDVAMSQAVLRCTLAMGGPTMADDYFERISVTSEIAEGLSAVIAEFNEEFSAEHPSGVTLRILQSDHEEEL
jgi:hypothetical protein